MTWASERLQAARAFLRERGQATQSGMIQCAEHLFRLVPEDVLDDPNTLNEEVYLALCSAYVEERVHLPVFLSRLQARGSLRVDVAEVMGLNDGPCDLGILWAVSDYSPIVRFVLRACGIEPRSTREKSPVQ